MFGIGGGIVIVPALILFYHFSPAMANGTSLAALLMPVGILAVIQYYRARSIRIKTALFIALGIFSGVGLGATVATDLAPKTLKMLYGIFLLIISNNFIRVKDLIKRERRSEDNAAAALRDPNFKKEVVIGYAVGVLAGILAGFFGIGGGIVIVPVLTLFFHYPYKVAVGTSLLALLFPVGLPGVLIYYRADSLSVIAAVLIGIGLFLGAFAGAKITLRLPATAVRRAYGVFLILIALDFIVNS